MPVWAWIAVLVVVSLISFQLGRRNGNSKSTKVSESGELSRARKETTRHIYGRLSDQWTRLDSRDPRIRMLTLDTTGSAEDFDQISFSDQALRHGGHRGHHLYDEEIFRVTISEDPRYPFNLRWRVEGAGLITDGRAYRAAEINQLVADCLMLMARYVTHLAKQSA